MAARIRGAQERVRQARLSIVAGEYNSANSQRRVDEYDYDPAGFADRYYRPHGIDSYPVQTTIARERERIDYHNRRHPSRITELAAMEIALRTVEAEVFDAVSKMRPSPGRIPWPKPLPPFEKYRDEFAAEMQRLEDESEAEQRRIEEEFDRIEAEQEARWAAEDRR